MHTVPDPLRGPGECYRPPTPGRAIHSPSRADCQYTRSNRTSASGGGGLRGRIIYPSGADPLGRVRLVPLECTIYPTPAGSRPLPADAPRVRGTPADSGLGGLCLTLAPLSRGGTASSA